MYVREVQFHRYVAESPFSSNAASNQKKKKKKEKKKKKQSFVTKLSLLAFTYEYYYHLSRV